MDAPFELSTVPTISGPPPLPPRRKLPSNDSSQTKDTNMSTPAVPPPLPPRKIPGGFAQTDDSPLILNLEDAEENGLDETQLRELYDNEEIDRFLTLFSDYVTEVQVVGTGSSTGNVSAPSHIPEDEEWTPISRSGEISSSPTVTLTPTARSKNLSEKIAYRYVLPILSPARPSPPPFTVGRLRLTAQRIYLAILPVYGPFFSQLVSLATWEDGNTSLIYCSIYWTLWWFDFLIPTLVLCVIFALLKRRIFGYPSLEDLRRHREEVIRADKFGDQVSARLSATSSGVEEFLYLFKLFDKSRKKSAKQKAKDTYSANPTEEIGDVPLEERDTVVPEDTDDRQVAADIKGIVLYALNEIADLHERVRNIFLWRRPASSLIYSVALFVLFLVTMLPAQILSKLIFFILGFLFWHIVPVLASLAPSDIARFPPPFSDVPTDVEYAMQLVSQRVAAGLEIKPARVRRDRLHQTGTSDESPEESGKASQAPSQTSENPINWKKWGNRVALGKSAVSDIAGFKFGNPWTVPQVEPVESHTYPCQHSSAPGLITLTQNTMFFTPLLRHDAKIIIGLTAIKGVKKVGMLKGLQVRWSDASEDKEDRFLWIAERDDLFARLVGLDGYQSELELLSFLASTMFFTPELLTRRDSGFGLLWLAATLGSKSVFKKLPRRSVLTADIAQLCDLISEPAEPLALRLSSNLMFGVVRVYKVKQEILMSDVTNCVTSLKKVVQDLRASGSTDGQLQMANPVARHSALTIVPNPRAAYTLDYEALVANWEEYLNIEDVTTKDTDLLLEDADGDFDPLAETQSKKRSKSATKVAPGLEVARKETHTLDEHHDHLLSASYELSFSQPGPLGGEGPSSSQVEAPFENFFPFSDGLDLGDGLGDDFARELGWDLSPVKSAQSDRNMHVDYPMIDFDQGNDLGINFNFSLDDVPMLENPAAPLSPIVCQPDVDIRSKQTPKKRKAPGKENAPLLSKGSAFSRATSTTSFSAQFLSQDQDQPLPPLRDITSEERNKANQADPIKKVKRTRLLLDARTELTDDELRVARAKYLESQNTIKREILTKKLEKNSGRIIEELVWGVPKGIEAQSLIDFWQENFKVQVEARSGALRIHHEDEGPPLKRRKTESMQLPEIFEANHDDMPYLDVNVGMAIDFGGNDPDIRMDEGMDEVLDLRHSSEEPGQARRVSRPSPIQVGGHNLAFDLDPDNVNGSQRSSLFPWDNAGASSSNGNAADAGVSGSENFIDQVDIRLRSNSPSHHDSSIVPIGSIGLSPVLSGRGFQVFGEDFAFDVENGAGPEETQQETQKSDLNLITLERNSYNFLEYTKMQYQTLSKPNGQLTFETVVPNLSSTRHVAAAAFYHCLVLATKDLIHLEQSNPYEPFKIIIV